MPSPRLVLPAAIAATLIVCLAVLVLAPSVMLSWLILVLCIALAALLALSQQQRQIAEHTAAHERDLLHALLDHVPDRLYFKDKDGRFLRINRALADRFGLTDPAQAIGKTDADFFAPEFARQSHADEQAVIKFAQPLVAKEEMETWPSGKRTWASTTTVPFRDPDGQIIGTFGLSRDITERKFAEEDLRQRVQLTALSADVGACLAQTGLLRTCLQECAECLVRYLDLAFARVWLLVESENMLVLHASAGMYTHLNGPHARVALGQFKIGRIAQECRPLLTNAITEDPDIGDREWARREGMVAFAGYPLHIEGRAVGVLAVFARHPLAEEVTNHLASMTDSIAQYVERKRAERALTQAEIKYRGIFENAVEGIYQTSVNGRLLTANPMFASIYGYDSPDQIVAQADFVKNHFYADPGRRAEFMELMRNQQSVTGFESQVRRKDGSLVWVSENARNVYGPEGALLGFEGTVIDITERKRSEETLRKANDALRAVIEDSPLGIIALGLDGVVQGWNMAAELMFGWTAEEVVGKRTPIIPPDRIQEFWDLLNRLRRGESFTGVRLQRLRKDGVLLDVSLSAAPLYDALGNVRGVTVMLADITEVTRAEEALGQERALLRGLIDSIPDLIFHKDNKGIYQGCNAAFANYVGRQIDDIIGLTTGDLFPDDVIEVYQVNDRQALAEGKPRRFEQWMEYPDGRRVLHEVLKTPFFGSDGHILGLIGISRDITERKRLEEQLQQSQKMEAIGQLAGGVAHDFNNLLTAILGNVSLLMSGEFNKDLLRDTERAALRAADLTKQLLGFSRRTMLRLEPTNLSAATEEAVRLLRRTIDPRITVTVHTARELWPVQADPGQMNQVVMNLCLNARDAMPEGGTLSLETANVLVEEDYTRVHLESHAGEFVRLRVRDTGHGIPSDIRSRIFDPFFTTKGPGKGTGLGLAMVFGIVKQHQGWIECTSEVGKGTDFDIYVPRAKGAVVKPVAVSVHGKPAGGSETILLVDDEPVIRSLGRTILERHGYRVLLASDGQEALEVYQPQKGAIDLVILDLTMPRLSGGDTLRHLRQFDPGVRVLFSSGYSAEQLTKSTTEGVLGFVNKPYRPQDLVNTVRWALDQARAGVE